MPFVTVADSRIHYLEFGTGAPLVFLHCAWGYRMYPLDTGAPELAGFHVLIPDRSGYGRSSGPARFEPGYHHRAAAETLALMDALGIESAVLWGHSDGAVIAAMLGLAAPQCSGALVLEAFHLFRDKPGSRDFFQAVVQRPNFFGGRLSATLAQDHGEPYWRELVGEHARAWLEMPVTGGDLYDGRLKELAVPTLVLHGAGDPRTEPGELDAVRAALPAARIRVIEGGSHAPHCEEPVSRECMRMVGEWLRENVSGPLPAGPPNAAA